MSPSSLQLICALTGAVPVGSGRFAGSSGFSLIPNGAQQQSSIPIGTVAGSVSDVYFNNNLANLTIASAAVPLSLTLSALNNPAGVSSAFLHISHIILENLDLANSLTLSRGASNPVTFLPAVANVNAVFAMPFVDSSGSGTFKITVEGVQTGAITYNSTAATLVSNINTALNSTYGSSAIVASGGSLAAIILTCSGTGFSGRGVTTPTATLVAGSTGYTINGVGTVALNTPLTVSTTGYTGGIVLPPAQSSAQSSFLVLAVPAGMPIVASTSDQMQLSVPGGASNVLCNATILGRNT